MKTDTELTEELSAKMCGEENIDHIVADEFVIKVLADAGYPELSKMYDNLTDHFWYA
jgi:hypothetical protein